MIQFLAVFLGGGFGCIARYQTNLYFLSRNQLGSFPTGTFVANVVGCLLIGIFAGISEKYTLPKEINLFIVPGLLGGFTTFSAFGLETFSFLKRGEPRLAFIYGFSSVLFGVFAVLLGFFATKKL